MHVGKDWKDIICNPDKTALSNWVKLQVTVTYNTLLSAKPRSVSMLACFKIELMSLSFAWSSRLQHLRLTVSEKSPLLTSSRGGFIHSPGSGCDFGVTTDTVTPTEHRTKGQLIQYLFIGPISPGQSTTINLTSLV